MKCQWLLFLMIFPKVRPIAAVRLRGVLYSFVQRSLGIRHGWALFLVYSLSAGESVFSEQCTSCSRSLISRKLR
jgi:hypothetical protein